MRFQVPPKTFSLDSWITELDHATNLVVSSKPSDRRLGKPKCQKCCNETANIQFAIRLRNDLYCVGLGVKLYSLTHFSLRSTVTWIVYNIIDYILYIVLDLRHGWL